MDLVLFSGYARMPSNTTAQRIYEELALVARMERQYQGHLKKALVSAIKMVGTQYADMCRSESNA